MNVPSHAEVLEYARRLQSESHQALSVDDMRRLLEARFLRRQDFFAGPPQLHGAIENPMDWLKGLSSIIVGLIAWKDGHTWKAVKNVIEGVITIVC